MQKNVGVSDLAQLHCVSQSGYSTALRPSRVGQTPAVPPPVVQYHQCYISVSVLWRIGRVLVIDDGLYTSARYGRRR